MSVRYRAPGGDWESAGEAREVAVPGTYYPHFSSEDREVELSFERDVVVPDAWGCHLDNGGRTLVELDSVDYRATVEWISEDGEAAEIGRHEGYLGRFAVDLGGRRKGRLRVKAWDLREGSGEWVESVERTTLQGIDPTGWGINVSGIRESVRLRLTGAVYLRNAFAAAVALGDPATIRFGAELLKVRADQDLDSIRWQVLAGEEAPGRQGGEVLAEGSIPAPSLLLLQEDEAEQFAEVEVPGLPPSFRGWARLAVLDFAGVTSDVRVVPLWLRRVDVAGNRLRVDGSETYLKGTGLIGITRLLPVEPGSTPGERYFAHSSSLDERMAAVVEVLRKAHVSWIRPAHHLPLRRFHETWRAGDLLVYQDFPLHWHTDFEALTPGEIRRQFDELLWRVASEPAVGLLATHNEAEIKDPEHADGETVHALIESLMRRAAKLAPHLTTIGSSGSAGTAVFPPDPAFATGDAIVDKHAYFGGHFTPLMGFRDIPAAVEGIGASDGRPVIWSELGGGWQAHFEYLLGLGDTIVEDDTEAELRRWFVRNGQQYSTRQVYAIVSCRFFERASDADLAACVAEQAVPANDALLIERAREHYFADRAAVTRPADGELQLWRRRITTEWLAAQLYEARIQHLSGGDFAGTIPWDLSVDIGFPAVTVKMSPRAAEAAPDARKAVAAAYAPVAVYARPMKTGEAAEVMVLNDGEEVDATLELSVGGTVLGSKQIVLGAAAVTRPDTSALIGAAEEHPGEIATLRLLLHGELVSSYRLVLRASAP